MSSIARTRDDLQVRLKALSKDLAKTLDKSFSEQATQLENRDVELGLREEALAELFEVEAALNRLEEGTYGTCRSCAEPIAFERLQAYPAAVTCIDCASREQAPG